MSIFYSDSKTDLKLWCNCIWNSKYSRVPKTFLVDWRQCVSCYYPTTPTDYPSTIRGRSVGRPVAVNIDICGYLQFFSIIFVSNGYSTPLTTFLVKKEFLLHTLVLMFQPTANSRASNNCSKQCQNRIVSWEKCAVSKVLIYILMFVKGFRRWRGYILAPVWKPDLKGSWSIASHSSQLNRIEQNCSKLRHTVCDIYISRLALKG